MPVAVQDSRICPGPVQWLASGCLGIHCPRTCPMAIQESRTCPVAVQEFRTGSVAVRGDKTFLKQSHFLLFQKIRFSVCMSGKHIFCFVFQNFRLFFFHANHHFGTYILHSATDLCIVGECQHFLKRFPENPPHSRTSYTRVYGMTAHGYTCTGSSC